jgi:diguanylate cyclase (GGDEF)-like protein/PAS domain S-box-containing protein
MVVMVNRVYVGFNSAPSHLIDLIDSLPGIVYCSTADAHWSMTYLSKGCFNLTGYDSHEIMGPQVALTWDQLTHPEDLVRVNQSIHQAVSRQEPYVIEYRILTKSGAEKWIWEKGMGVFDEAGHVLGLQGFITDISDLKHTNKMLLEQKEALRLAEEKYRSIFENAVEGIFQSTPEGQYMNVNPALARIYGYDSPRDLIETLANIGQTLYVQPQRRAEFVALMHNSNTLSDFESEVFCKDGRVIWISEHVRAVRDAQGTLLHYEGITQDITARKQAESELQRRDALLKGVAAATNYLLVNTEDQTAIAKALSALGTAAAVDRVYIYENHPHGTTGKMAMSMRHEWTRPTIQPSINQPHWQNQPYEALGLTHWYEALLLGQTIKGITSRLNTAQRMLLNKDKILSIILVPILIDGTLWGYIGFDDCQRERQWSKSEETILHAMAGSFGGAIKRQLTESTMRHQALHDQLTELPNRLLFNDRLSVILTMAHRHSTQAAILFIDLDRFKVVNDTLGHAVGDRLLRKATKRLLSCLRQEDTIARWGGDEFTIVLPNLTQPGDVIPIVERILAVMLPPFLLEGHELHVTSSIGIALYPQDGKDEETLVRNADAALYRAKAQGRNNYQFYLPMMNAQSSELLLLDSQLRHALERNEFIVHYQPIVTVRTGEIRGIEALIRWNHPEKGLLLPGTFIPFAEENGFIIPIGEWILKTACAQNQAWQAMGLPAIRVAVNLSAQQFQQTTLVEKVASILEETGLSPQHLELEITETAVMQDVEFTRFTLKMLMEMGVHLSVDDFGTGYSSLGYLKRFPLHTIKIDRAFVQELTLHSADAAIISAVIALGQGLNLSVVAEGVETPEQLNLLKSLDCDEYQGFLFSQSLPAGEITHLLKVQQAQRAQNALSGIKLEPPRLVTKSMDYPFV